MIYKSISFQLFIALFVLILFVKCNYLTNNINDKIIARIGDELLYLSDIYNDLENLSGSDSLIKSKNLIENWARKKLLFEKSKLNLSLNTQEELDVLVDNYKHDLFAATYKELILKSWLLIFLVVNLDLLIEYFSGKNIFGYKSTIDGRLASFLDDELKIGGYYFGFCLLSLATVYGYFRKDYKTIFGFAISFLIIAFLIGERSNFIKILFSILCVLFFYFKEHKFKLVFLSLICAIIFSTIIYQNENLKYRYFSQWNKNNVKTNIYFTHYKTAILVFKKYPIFGSGIKNFRIEVKKIIEEEFKDDDSELLVKILNRMIFEIDKLEDKSFDGIKKLVLNIC